MTFITPLKHKKKERRQRNCRFSWQTGIKSSWMNTSYNKTSKCKFSLLFHAEDSVPTEEKMGTAERRKKLSDTQTGVPASNVRTPGLPTAISLHVKLHLVTDESHIRKQDRKSAEAVVLSKLTFSALILVICFVFFSFSLPWSLHLFRDTVVLDSKSASLGRVFLLRWRRILLPRER